MVPLEDVDMLPHNTRMGEAAMADLLSHSHSRVIIVRGACARTAGIRDVEQRVRVCPCRADDCCPHSVCGGEAGMMVGVFVAALVISGLPRGPLCVAVAVRGRPSQRARLCPHKAPNW